MILLSADQPSINLGLSALSADPFRNNGGGNQRLRRLASQDDGFASNDLQQAQRVGASPGRNEEDNTDLAAIEGERGNRKQSTLNVQNTSPD